MGHAHHFLQRVHERARGEEADFFLGLYRDTAFVRALLGELEIPDPRARVALSYAEGGPCAIVTQDGAFVTCLAEGMRPTGAFVVSRGKIDAVFAKSERLRELRALAVERGLDDRQAIEKLQKAGPGLSREDFLATAGLLGPATTVLMGTYAGCHQSLEETVPFLMQRDLDAGLREAWKREVAGVTWGMAHAALLHVDNAPRDWMEQWAEMPGFDKGSPFMPLVMTFEVSFQARAAWIAGRLGKPFFPKYKKRFATSQDPFDLLEAGWGLAAMSLRHASLRAEAVKALQVAPPPGTDHVVVKMVRQRFAEVASVLSAGQEHEAAIVAAVMETGRREVMDQTAHLEEGSRFRYADAASVPDDLALAAMLEMPLDGLSLESELRATFGVMAGAVLASARKPAEVFYLPSAYLFARKSESLEQVGERLVERRRQLLMTDATVKRETPKVGRNEPCPCGSGKKFKKCCGG
jgi:hypothetical protein